MTGTWRWNAALGIFGALLTLLFSLGGNGPAITGIRCVYAFIAFFLLAFPFRALVSFILRPGAVPAQQSPGVPDAPAGAGNLVDMSTPDESRQLHDMLKKQMEGGGTEGETHSAFQPLNPPKLVSTQNKDPEELAKALRHLTGG